ncbi:MAG: hypothetical protein ACXWN4_08465 [Candidatus Limnocylindrales bacterium]
MSKRHQASRRRTYGRRQHEMHERPERHAGLLGWLDGLEIPGVGDRWDVKPSGNVAPGNLLQLRGIH